MKKLLILTIVSLGLSAMAGTNTVTVRIDLSDLQGEQLKFLARYYQTTNSLKDFATNVVAEIKWTPQAEFVLSQRRERITSAVNTVDDTAFKALENALGLPPLTNSVPLAP